MTKHFFLCAVGRSGTTVFRTGLGKHPGVYYNGKENNVVQEILNLAYDNCTLKSRKFAMVVQQEEYNAIFRQTIESLIWPDESLHSRPLKLAAINPEGSQLSYLRELFPGSKIVGLVRNGIEVVSSRMAFASFADRPFKNHCEVWNRSLSVINWGSENPKQFRLFRQEWFYQPDVLKAQLDSVFQWLELEPSERPLDHITQTLRHPTDSTAEIDTCKFAQATDDQKRRYFLSKRDRWQSWSESHRDMFADICGAGMEQLGYEIPWA